MSFNLANLASDLVSVAKSVENAASQAQQIYSYAGKVVAAAETAYAGQTGAGATKKAAVLAAAEAFATSLGANWSLISSALSAWIDVLIAAWNAAADIAGAPTVNQAAVDTTVQSVETVASVVVGAGATIAEIAPGVTGASTVTAASSVSSGL